MEFIKKIFEKIKQAIHNKFFQEVYCSNCGAKDKIMNLKKLKDESLLCKKCMGKIPSELNDTAQNSLSEYKNAVAYAERSANEFEPIFNNDAGFHLFEVDSKNKLFRLDTSDNALIFELSNISYYDFNFIGEKAKEGLLNDKVIGNVHLTLLTENPCVNISEIVAYSLKVKAPTSLFSTTINHGNPKELDAFLLNFKMLCETAKKEQESK